MALWRQIYTAIAETAKGMEGLQAAFSKVSTLRIPNELFNSESTGTWFAEIPTNGSLFSANYDRNINDFSQNLFFKPSTALAQVTIRGPFDCVLIVAKVMCNVIDTNNDLQAFVTYTVAPGAGIQI